MAIVIDISLTRLFVCSVVKENEDGSCTCRHTLKDHAVEVNLHGHFLLMNDCVWFLQLLELPA
jgi:hypothetical protein